MAVSVVVSSPAARRGALLVLLIAALAAAVGIAIFRPGMSPDRFGAFGDNVANQAGNAAATLKSLGNTVSQIFESRSPGERLGGALASLKHRRPALHERALPKVRGPASPLAAIVGAPVIPPIAAPVPETPLYNVVQGTPVPVGAPPPGGGPPVVVPGGPPLPGGGGGVIFPPIVSQPPTPPVTPPETPPNTPSVPEPGSWAMMLLGFALIGGALRRSQINRLQAT